jgi:hypothetical protein
VFSLAQLLRPIASKFGAYTYSSTLYGQNLVFQTNIRLDRACPSGALYCTHQYDKHFHPSPIFKARVGTMFIERKVSYS